MKNFGEISGKRWKSYCELKKKYIWRTMIFYDFLKYFRITCGEDCIIFKENSWDFWLSTRWSSWVILMKFWRNVKGIDKIFNDSKKIMETLLEKIEIIWNWCWEYKEILESFSETVSMKWETNYEGIFKKVLFCM